MDNVSDSGAYDSSDSTSKEKTCDICGKTIINAFKSNKDKQSPFKRKSRFTKNPYYQNNFKQEDIINVEIDQENKEEEIFTKKENDNITVFSSIDSPNKAFFI